MITEATTIYEKSTSVWPWAVRVVLSRESRHKSVDCSMTMYADFLPYGETSIANIPLCRSEHIRDSGKHVLPVTGVAGYVQTLAYAYEGNFEMQDALLIQREIGKAYNKLMNKK